MPHKDADARQTYQQEYYTRNLEKKKSQARERYVENREPSLLKSKEWREAHPGYSAKQSRQWRAANPEKHRALVEHYRTRCNKLQNERKRKQRQADPTLVRIKDKVYSYRRKALGQVTTDDIIYIINRDNYKCGICGRRVNKKQFSIDHILPISQGGDNSKSNLRLSHLKCNVKRRDKGFAQLRLLD